MLVISMSSCSVNSDDVPPAPQQSTDEATGSSQKSEEEIIVSTSYEKPPTYEEIQAEYPGKTVLTWVIDGTAPHYRTKEINEYLDSSGCDFAVSFKPAGAYATEDETDFYSTLIGKMIADGEQIDILHSSSRYWGEAGISAYCNFVQYGFFEPLDEYLETEKGQALYELMPENHWEALRVNGSIYGVDGAMTSLRQDYGYYVNAELADKYGFDIFKPIDEQLDILQQIKENENCGDIFAFGGNKLEEPAFYFTSAKDITYAVYWDGEEHTAKCILDNPEYLEKLRLFDALSKNKLLTNAAAAINQTFFIAQVHKAGGHTVYESAEPVDYDYRDDVNAVKVYPVYSEPTAIRNSYNATGICSASRNKEKAFELLALTQTDPYLNNLMVYGAEGIDYDLTEDGKANKSVDFDLDRYANYMICLKNTDFRGFIPDLTAEEYQAVYENAVISEDFDFAPDCSGLEHEINTTNIIMGSFHLPGSDQALDEYLSEFRERLENAGMQKIIDECNRQYERRY